MTLDRIRLPVIFALLASSAFVCADGNVPASQSEPDRPGIASWSTDVIGIEEMHLSADYWVNNDQHPNEALDDLAGINAFNANAYANDSNLVDLSVYPEQLTSVELKQIIRSISKPYHSDLYYHDGGHLEESDYQRYRLNLGLDALMDSIPVRFGLVLKRADMRTWPSSDSVFKSQATRDLDRFQENGLFPADFVAVLHESKDGQWYFVQSYNYAAWVRKDHVAIGDRSDIIAYKQAERFVVVTGDKVTTTFNPTIPAISELQLDMGVRLPLVDPAKIPANINGQNPYTSYVVSLPVSGEAGRLEFEAGLIARRHDVRKGYLPFTHENILRQGFKFLGERYGWGHSYNGRDCTGLVSEIYKTFGIIMPRNSGQQGSSSIGQNIRFSDQDNKQARLEALASAEVGDLLYFPGHVMMYIGSVEGQPYVLHDTSSGLSYINEEGKPYKGILNGVSVTPLIPLHMSDESTYVEKMYAIKKIR